MGPKNHKLDGSRSPMGSGNFEGQVRPLYTLGTFYREMCKIGIPDRLAVLVVDSGEAK